MKPFFRFRISRFLQNGALFFFALTIVLIPFRWRLEILARPVPPIYSDYTDFHLFASDLALMSMLAFWAFSLLAEPRALKFGSALMGICLIGLTVAAWVSVLGSEDPVLSRYHAVRFIGLFLLYLFAVNEIHSPLWAIVPAALQIGIQSIIGMGQSLAQSSLGLQMLGEHMLDPARPGTSVVQGEGLRFLRAYGLSDHPNILGGCIAFGLVLLLAVTLYGKGRQPALASAVFLAVFPALVMTFSRSAWLSLVAAGGFMVGCEAAARRWDSVKRAIALGVLSLFVVFPFLAGNWDVIRLRINSGDMAGDDTMRERAFLMEAGNTLFVEHSAIGVGLGASPIAMLRRFGEFPLNFQPPHYAVLTVALETGVIGGAFYLLLLLAPAAAFLLHWRALIHQPLTMGALALLLALAVVGLFDYYTWTYAPGRLWQWLGWGLYSAARTRAG